MSFKYGASFNCYVGGEPCIGKVDEGVSTLNYVSNDLDKLKAKILDNHPTPFCHFDTDHRFVTDNNDVDIGGTILAVLVDEEGNDIAVVFTLDYNGPIVVD